MAELTSDGSVTLKRQSAYYQTSPVEYEDQPEFLNNVIEVETGLEAEELWERISRIESVVNDPKPVPKGPRLIDMDVLLYGDLIMKSDKLTIPHAAICQRRFVLVPLLELTPQVMNPVDGSLYRDCLAALDDSGQKVEPYHE